MSHSSAIPTVYYLIFAFYEPFLCVSSLIGTFADPKKVSFILPVQITILRPRMLNRLTISKLPGLTMSSQRDLYHMLR